MITPQPGGEVHRQLASSLLQTGQQLTERMRDGMLALAEAKKADIDAPPQPQPIQSAPPPITSKEEFFALKPKPAKRPTPAPPGSHRQRLADELKLAWRLAGEPSLASLSRTLYRAAKSAASKASISKALSGSTGRPPRWTLMESLLIQFDVDPDEIAGYWRELWVQAREEVAPLDITTSTAVPGAAFAAFVAQGGLASAPDPDRPSNNPVILVDTSSSPRWPSPPPEGHECEDCGSWVVNTERHHAWHWTIERQLRRANLRSLDTGT